MGAILNAFGANELRQPGDEEAIHVPFAFSTNGSGVPALAYNYDGLLSISTNGAGPFNYVISLGAQYKSCKVAYSNPSPVATTTSFDPVAGTVTLTYATAILSNTYHGLLVIGNGYK